MKLPEQHRNTIIDRLAMDFVNAAAQDHDLLYDAACNGLVGYKNLDDEVLIQYYVDADLPDEFDNDIPLNSEA